jgi:hypothetical protein
VIKKAPITNVVCDKCKFPIEGQYIKWRVGDYTLNLHPPCGLEISKNLRSNVYTLFSRQKE